MRPPVLVRALLACALAGATVSGSVSAAAAPADPAAADSNAAAPAPAAQTEAYPTSSVQLTGHGYGHGRGMGQWGAYGYATDDGWSHQQILSHYYGGTTQGTTSNVTIGVRLLYRDGLDLVVTSGRDFTVDNVRILAGKAARIQLRSDGQFTVYPRSSCGGTESAGQVRPTSKVTSTVASPGADLAAMLAVCTSSGDTNQYRGTLQMAQFDGSPRTVNNVLMEDYLRSVVPKESPASWADSGGGAALRSQAVAARSYAYSENRYDYAKTCDTTSCQVYSGAGRNRVSQEDYRSDAAIVATANVVLRSAGGSIVRAEFSSSTGGYTAGGTFPAVRDDGDDASPYHDWTDSIPVSSVQSAYGVGTLSSVQITARNGLGEDGGRARTVRITGSARTVELTGDEFRLDWGLLSDWYSVVGSTMPPPPPPLGPTLTWFPTDRNAAGAGPTRFGFGSRGDQPVACDWDGDGDDTPGVFRAGVFYLRNSNSAGPTEITAAFGQSGDVPVCGDWDADGDDSIGVWRKGQLFLRFTNAAGSADITSSYGTVGDIPVMGDWNADGYDTIAIFRAGQWHVSDSNRTPFTSYRFDFGQAGDQPLAGDWAETGSAGPAVRRDGVFHQRYGVASIGTDNVFAFGLAADAPLSGDWNRDGADTVAVVRPS
ncbi:MAG: hypothetical protein H0T85_03645 [Geodermatophilaceae bacterium]|nr:hypothetical protein [Geodermatophilaceae bacterium]